MIPRTMPAPGGRVGHLGGATVDGLQGIGKALVGAGIALALLGGLLWIGGRIGLGSLPGDIRLGGERWGCYLPIASSLLISLLLSLILGALWRWLGR